ncbi:HEPN domain-containing protein [Thermodesulfobacteriota bacterium]
MMTENIKALVEYRQTQADESLDASEVLIEKNLLRPSVNRAYYAMFYGVLALLAIDKMETSKHGGAISLFDREFVKEGVFTKDFSRWLHDAFDLHQRVDYSPEYYVSHKEAERTLKNAVNFVEEVKKQTRSLLSVP